MEMPAVARQQPVYQKTKCVVCVIDTPPAPGLVGDCEVRHKKESTCLAAEGPIATLESAGRLVSAPKYVRPQMESCAGESDVVSLRTCFRRVVEPHTGSCIAKGTSVCKIGRVTMPSPTARFRGRAACPARRTLSAYRPSGAFVRYRPLFSTGPSVFAGAGGLSARP
jgi:hypothetical protein